MIQILASVITGIAIFMLTVLAVAGGFLLGSGIWDAMQYNRKHRKEKSPHGR